MKTANCGIVARPAFLLCVLTAWCATEGGPRQLLATSAACRDADACKPVELFVATGGNDLDPGTKERPFATLEGARDAIRELKRTGPLTGPVTVWIRGGQYSRTKTFQLTAQDSGAPAAPIVYRACPGEDVHLIGGRELDRSWCEPVKDPAILARADETTRGRLLQADLRAHGITDYDAMSHASPMLELFCNGKRLPVARWPNQGHTPIGGILVVEKDGTQRFADENKQGKTFLYDGDRPARWVQAEDVFLHGYWYFGWIDQHVRIDRIDAGKKEITLAETPGGGIKKGQYYYALNLLEEIDEPGEWYLDRHKGVLYFLPPEEFSDQPVFLSMQTELLLAMDQTSYVTVRGLTLEVTRGTGIAIGGGAQNRLAGCVVRCIGQAGIVLDHGTDNSVVGCDIHDLGMMAIRMTGGNRSTLEPGRNSVVNNHIYRYAQRKKVYEPAVRIYGVGHRVAHNLIHDAPHQAIGYDGNDHVVEFNEIHDVVLESSDAGVIYSGCNWTFRGNVVRHNFIHHIPHGPGLGTVGVYLDDCASSTEISGNVFFDMLNPTFIGGGRDHVIANNIFIQCDTPVHLDSRGLRWEHFRPNGPMYDQLKEVKHSQPPWSTRYPALGRILDEIPQAPLGNVLVNNVSYRSSWRDPEAHCRQTSENNIDRPYMSIADNYVTNEDPGFVDAAKWDFRLRGDSVVYRTITGFKKIPFEEIGLYHDEFRATWPVVKKRPP